MVQELENWLEMNARTFNAFFAHDPNYEEDPYYNQWIDMAARRPTEIFLQANNNPEFWYLLCTFRHI